MIALSSDFMLFELGSGESVPFSADMITVELTGGTTSLFDADFVKHAAKAVFHYFRQELRRETVTMAEFAESIEKVLKGFALSVDSRLRPEQAVAESDLSRLAFESGKGCELFFFPRLRDEVRDQLRNRPRVLHFRG